MKLSFTFVPAAMFAAVNCLSALIPQLIVLFNHEPTEIMPLGDSITGSPGCWRAYKLFSFVLTIEP